MRNCSVCTGHGVITLRDKESGAFDFVACQECKDYYRTKTEAERSQFYNESALFMAQEALLQADLDLTHGDGMDDLRRS